jgi:hypothetical protein
MVLHKVIFGPRKGKSTACNLYIYEDCTAVTDRHFATHVVGMNTVSWNFSVFTEEGAQKKRSYTVTFCWVITVFCSVVMHLL